MEWISHEDRTLKEHLLGLKEVVESILLEKEQHFFKKEKLKELVLALIAYHDLAKTSIFFQTYLCSSLLISKKNHKNYKKEELERFLRDNKSYLDEWESNPKLKNHALFGGWISLFYWDKELNYSINNFLFLMILKAHHGALKNFLLASINPKNESIDLTRIGSTINISRYKSMIEQLGLPFHNGEIADLFGTFSGRKFDQLVYELSKNKSSSYYFQTLFLFSFLLSADKGDMMLRNKEFVRTSIKSNVIDDFKNTLKTKHSINELREEAYQTSVSNVIKLGENNFYSLTLPTGLGKTFTAYKAALQIKEEYDPNFRIIYCLPFTSIIDQNAKVFKDILANSSIDSNCIGIHHYLSTPNLTDKDDELYPEWEYMTEGWQREITVTTFVQLWESIFACHNRQLRKFHNLANSIIILDEVQSINPRLFPALEFALKGLAKYFNTKFIFVTATQPILLSDEVKELCHRESSDYFFTKMNRTILNTSLLEREEEIIEEELAEMVIDDFEEKKQSILIICNTIRYSQNVVKALSDFFDEEDLFYLSASIIPHSREEIRNKVQERLTDNDPIILVSTQVVEAGVDIDFDKVYRDFAPLSSINQAAGRCNRNAGKGISEVKLFRSGKEKIYDPTQLDITQNVLKIFPNKIPENLFFDLNQLYFKAVKEKIQNNSNIANDLIKDIQRLKFQDIGTKPEYRLFVEQYKSYNYFIPLNDEANKVWDKYLEKFEIEDVFKRKQAIKLLIPLITQFVVKIPDYIPSIRPTEEEKEKSIIYGEDWKDFYDKKFGYKISDKENRVELF